MSQRDDEFLEFMRNRASPLHQSAYLLCGDQGAPGIRFYTRIKTAAVRFTW